MARLLILGAGGHGKVVADCALATGKFTELAFLDDRHPGLSTHFGCPVVGPLSAVYEAKSNYDAIALGLGDNRLRRRWCNELADAGFPLPPIVHPASWTSPSAALGAGTVVFAGAVVNCDARIGEAVIVNTGATVDHDCMLAAGVHLSPGVHLAGDVQIGVDSWMGIGSVAIQGCRIGRDVWIGAGAAVLGDLPDHVVAVGTPARVIKQREPYDDGR